MTTTTITTTNAAQGSSTRGRRDRRRNRRRLARVLLGLGFAGATTIALGAGPASAMTMQQWRARCAAEGGEWSTYLSGGIRFYECLWVTSSGYSYDVYQSHRGGDVRFERMCGGNFRTEDCYDI